MYVFGRTEDFIMWHREEDKEIQRFLSGEVMKFCFGDKSKFIKSTLIRAIQGIKREENEKQFVCEMNKQCKYGDGI